MLTISCGIRASPACTLMSCAYACECLHAVTLTIESTSSLVNIVLFVCRLSIFLYAERRLSSRWCLCPCPLR